MIRYDSHVHTCFSTDSKEEAINYIKEAQNKGFLGITFTDHNDYDFPLDNGKVQFALDFDSYIDYMTKLRFDYNGIFDIRIGVEQGLMKSVASRVNEYDKHKKLDFIIGSSHLVNGNDPYYESFWEGKDVKECINAYYEASIDNVKYCDNFDVYGHLDYLIRYAPTKDRDYNWKDYYDYIYEILKSLIYKGKGIEINTSGLKSGLKNPNPELDIVKLYKSLGGEIITVGSDAHFKEYFGYRFDIIENYLKEAGFNYYSIFKNRKPEFIKI